MTPGELTDLFAKISAKLDVDEYAAVQRLMKEQVRLRGTVARAREFLPIDFGRQADDPALDQLVADVAWATEGLDATKLNELLRELPFGARGQGEADPGRG